MSVEQPSPVRVRLSILAILLLLGAMVALVWWRVLRPAPEAAVATARVPAPKAAPKHTPDMSGMGRAQLLGAARAAMQAQRLVAPAGDNAVAYYLQVLHDDPGNRAAADALRELFPFAAQAVEQTINAGQLDDAQRELDLLARVDATNYTLTLLRAKLGERRRLLAAAPAPSAPAKAPTHASRPAPAPEQARAAADAMAAAPAAPAPTRPTAPVSAPPPAPSPRAAQEPAIERTAPLLVFQMPPYYPASARRQHREGWVDVRYTVDPDGHVSGARVVGGKPGHLFDHAALTAVERWRFQPGTLNGTPVPVTVTSRVDFRLPD